MYARDLMVWLHERLAERGTFHQTQKRFESLRGYNLLPRGRENAGVRLSNDQITNAILAFGHPAPGFAGHASLILGGLQPVGGQQASFRGAPTLKAAIAKLVEAGDSNSDILRLTLSVEEDLQREHYTAALYFKENGQSKTVSFVSKYAYSLFRNGAEAVYNHERLDNLTAVQRSLSSQFFRELSRAASISRQLNRPLKTDWREYETEEEKAEFYRKLGARRSSDFLNLRVDAQVTWPKEPTRMRFGSHHFVLFPRTNDTSHSISLDLRHERISADDARSLMNRLLSIMSWCDDQPASLHEGWSGNPVPVPVPKQNQGSTATPNWYFYRTLPDNRELLRCLAYYRDGLNAYSAGLASHAVLSFFRVFETRYDKKLKVIKWVNSVISDVMPSNSDGTLNYFESDRKARGVDVGTYIYENCRVATAHAARDVPSDPDEAEESRRLLNASEVMRHLARYYIQQEYSYSTSPVTDNPL